MDIVLIGIGLSMDAFAVSLCKGLCMKRLRMGQAAVIALFFGAFQALMPLLGWLLGRQFERYITSFDHWIAFGLLCVIGGKMIVDALGEKEEACEVAADKPLNLWELTLMAVATSIDALAVGLSFALLGTPIGSAALVIGCITFALCLAGVALGFRFGTRYRRKAEITGGCVLILIGLKILLEHLGVL